MMFIYGHGREDYVNGATIQPGSDDPKFEYGELKIIWLCLGWLVR